MRVGCSSRRGMAICELYILGTASKSPGPTTTNCANPSFVYPQREKPQLLQAIHPSFRIKFPPHSGQPGIIP